MSETASQPASAPKSMDEIMSLCKRRGFVYQASEIYGGINGFWDYGPLGAQLKKNLREAWWQDMIMVPCGGKPGPGNQRVRCVPVETRIIQNPKAWEASGHVGGFNDPMVDDKDTKQRFRADHLVGLFVAQKVDGDQAWISAHQELMGWLVEGKPAPSWKLIKTSIGSLTEAFDQFARSKRIGRYRIAQASQTADYHPAAGIDKFTMSIGIEDEHGAMQWAKVLPITPGWISKFASEIPSPFSDKKGVLTPPRQFNLMFRTYIGATATEDDIAYLRPETAQGIFVQFKNVTDTTRVRIPFGIGNTGTSFRNEVTPRNFTFRSREFDQAELEFFCHPSESQEWYAFWRDYRMEWWKSLGLAGDNLRLREHAKDELSHYSSGTSDVEYRFPFTAPDFGELEGIAHRGDYDLRQHQQASGVKLEYFDTERGELLPNGAKKGERYLPHCIEPAAGLDRGVLAILCEAYTKDPSRPSPEIMRFHPRLAPIKAAVFPLVNKDGMPEVAEKLHDELVGRFAKVGFVETDAKQSIGKRYARMDEAGCPFCFTIDGDTLKDQTVTVRDRDSGTQQRIAIDKAGAFLGEKLGV
jgi:glycyl-tRNA synthetase